MAIRHCSVKTGRAGKGASHARYVQGEGRYAVRDDVAHVEHGNMPRFAVADPQLFWDAADANERANGRAYREVEFAVPREFADRENQIGFARQMAIGIVGTKHPYTLAMHDTKAADGGRNVHVHLMFSERALDGIERGADQFFRRANTKNPEKGGAAKNRDMNSRAFVKDTRMRYEQIVNWSLDRAGHDARISMARNEQLQPEPKLGPAHQRAGHDERREARAAVVRELRAARAELQTLQAAQVALRSEILDLSGDLQAALQARDEMRRKAAEQLAKPLARPVENLVRKPAPPAEVVPAVPTVAVAAPASRDELVAELVTLIGKAPQLREGTFNQVSGTVLAANAGWAAMDIGREVQLLDRRQWPDLEVGGCYVLKDGQNGRQAARKPMTSQIAASLRFKYGDRLEARIRQWLDRDHSHGHGRDRGGPHHR